MIKTKCAKPYSDVLVICNAVLTLISTEDDVLGIRGLRARLPKSIPVFVNEMIYILAIQFRQTLTTDCDT